MSLISKIVLLLRYIRGLSDEELELMNLAISEYDFYDYMPRINIYIFKDIANGAGRVLTHQFSHEDLGSNTFIEQYIVDRWNHSIKLNRSQLQSFIMEHFSDYKKLIVNDFFHLFNIQAHQFIDVLCINRKTSFTILHILLYYYDYDEIRERVLAADCFQLPMIYAMFDKEYDDKESLLQYITYTHINIRNYVSKDELIRYLIQ